ncbi:hypothetical protein JCM5350_005930 [Sporobolomyces pararoseus]
MSLFQLRTIKDLPPNEAWAELKRNFEWSRDKTYSFVLNSNQALSVSEDSQVLKFVTKHGEILSRARSTNYPLVKYTTNEMTEEEKLEINHLNLVYSSFILQGLPRNWRWKLLESEFRKDSLKDWHPQTLLSKIRRELRGDTIL